MKVVSISPKVIIFADNEEDINSVYIRLQGILALHGT